MTKELIKDVAIKAAWIILGIVVLFFLFIGLSKVLPYAVSSLASAGASLTSVFVPGNNSDTQNTQTPATNATNTKLTNTKTTQTNTTNGSAVKATPSYYGVSDLSVSVISSRITNSFNNEAAVDILVSNVGTNIAPAWILRANLPTLAGDQAYVSTAQQSLAPGDGVRLTLSFTNARANAVMNISVEPTSYSAEANKTNNIAVANLSNYYTYTPIYSGYYANYGYNYNGYNPYGMVPSNLTDLTVKIIDVGTTDVNGIFIPTPAVRLGAIATVHVRVTNESGQPSPVYSLRAIFPTAINNTTNSTALPSLLPGQSAVYTFSMVNSTWGSGLIRVEVDPGNLIAELNENNNDAETSFQTYN